MSKHYSCDPCADGRRNHWTVKHISGAYVLPPTTGLASDTTKADAEHIADVCEQIAPTSSARDAGADLLASGYVKRMRSWCDPRKMCNSAEQHFSGLKHEKSA
tara:strand:- start:270 stop:578 length:309 start_codon:yes stop_codon:yes gene_type:complete